jgi:arylsulfatase A-like enzyme
LDYARSPQGREGPNFLIVLFDALSAQHMSLYGYNRDTTPNVARFAEKATVFHSHYAGGNYTSPGTASLFTGSYPWSHRAFPFASTVDPGFEQKNLFSLLPDSYSTAAYTHNFLAEVLLHQFRQDVDHLTYRRELTLADVGFSDRLFPNDYYVAGMAEEAGLIRALTFPQEATTLYLSIAHKMRRRAIKSALEGEYEELYPRGIPHHWDMIFRLEHAIDWIAEQMTTLPQPLLGYFQLLAPHDPYVPHRDFVDIFDDGWEPLTKEVHVLSRGNSREQLIENRRLYDEYLAFVDSEFGRLVDAMELAGVLDNTHVIFTSDHGEMFERGVLGHMTPTLYEPIIRVPLLISRPGSQRREDVYTSTSCVDLLPTILHLTGQAIPGWCEGQVLPTFGGDEVSDERTIFAVEAKNNGIHAPLTKGTIAMMQGGHKLIHYFGYPEYEDAYELYDLTNDPEELEDLFTSKRSLAAELQAQLAEELRRVNQPYF